MKLEITITVELDGKFTPAKPEVLQGANILNMLGNCYSEEEPQVLKVEVKKVK